MAYDHQAYQAAYRALRKKRAPKRIHGEAYYAGRYGNAAPACTQYFRRLPPRMKRYAALRYYGSKLNKIWKELGYV